MHTFEFDVLGHCPVNGPLVSLCQVQRVFAPIVEAMARNEQQLEMVLEHCVSNNLVREGECAVEAIINELARLDRENERLMRIAKTELQQHAQTIDNGTVECGLLVQQCKTLEAKLDQVTRERDQWKEVASV